MAIKRVALVTGANKGIGLEIVRQLAGHGVTVLLGSRNEARGQAAVDQLRSEGLDVHTVKIDVSQQSDIDNLAQKIEKEFGQLDILVNNAGVSDFGDADVSPEKFRAIYETNVFGPFALTRALLPLLKASPAGRIVNQSSVLASLSSMSKGQGGAFATPGYASSKAALNMLTVVTALELKDTNVKVNAAHPGWVRTDMGGANAPLTVEEGAKTAVDFALAGPDGPTGAFQHKGRPLPW